MAAAIRVLSCGGLNVVSFPHIGKHLHKKLVNFCLETKALHSCSLDHQSWHARHSFVRGIPSGTREFSSSLSSRVITPIMAELLKSIKYGKERWMDQKQRLDLVKKHEDGIIDHHSTDFEKLTLEHFQVFWPGGAPIWINYKRNFLGQFAPKRTREKCIRRTTVVSNPCPICRLKKEKNYTLVYTDVGLLSQFICPHTGLVLEVHKTGVCRRQQKLLMKVIEEAKDKGLLPFTIPGPRDPPRRFKAAGVPHSVKNKT